eukprot:g34900.t1
MAIPGIQFVLGNNLAGSKVGVMPLVVERPKENQGTEEFEGKYAGIFLDCVVARSRRHKLKQEGKTKEKDEEVEVQLAENLFDEMLKEKPKQVEDQAE